MTNKQYKYVLHSLQCLGGLSPFLYIFISESSKINKSKAPHTSHTKYKLAYKTEQLSTIIFHLQYAIIIGLSLHYTQPYYPTLQGSTVCEHNIMK